MRQAAPVLEALYATGRLGLSIKLLTERYQLTIIAPFHLSVNGEKYVIDALIEGYGARKGMLIVKNANTIKEVRGEIVALGYGFSCFDINANDVAEGFQEVLDDWGKCVI
ncbi:hypothetical protein [Shewanella xiamenensis]|uniref:hypothetical protein n=1 Tax=Shewanella xiamenensis TaxID=332186 RepID=UPI0004D62808|nr:hypothetical protein [Shewanella xiamenensis]KEK28542.1 hypothetical protein SXM_1717 [Shewanella xiamenensis]